MLFSILFTYPKCENQNLVLVCNEGILSAPNYFVIHLPPLAIVSTSCLVFVVALRVFVVEIWRWKANGKTNLMISKHLKIGRLQPEKSRNKFARIQKMKN